MHHDKNILVLELSTAVSVLPVEAREECYVHHCKIACTVVFHAKRICAVNVLLIILRVSSEQLNLSGQLYQLYHSP